MIVNAATKPNCCGLLNSRPSVAHTRRSFSFLIPSRRRAFPVLHAWPVGLRQSHWQPAAGPAPMTWPVHLSGLSLPWALYGRLNFRTSTASASQLAARPAKRSPVRATVWRRPRKVLREPKPAGRDLGGSVMRVADRCRQSRADNAPEATYWTYSLRRIHMTGPRDQPVGRLGAERAGACVGVIAAPRA